MKKITLAITLAGISVISHAQSSVTLYGVADAGITYVSNVKGASQYALTSGNGYASRWGVSGVEDLGADLKAIFTLESGYGVNNGSIGQNGTEFGRQAFVGLKDGSYGSLTAGRQYSTEYTTVGPHTAGGDWAAAGSGYGSHPGDVDNLDTFNRVANSIKYQSRSFGGLTFGGLYSFGGKSGNFTQNELWDISAAYSNGPLYLGAGYLYTKDPNFSFWGDKTNDSLTGNNMASPVNSGYASAGSQQIISAVGAYTIGPATIGLVFSNTQFKNLGSVSVAGLTPTESAYRGNASFDIGEINLKYNVTSALQLGAAYSYTRNSGADNMGSARYQQFDVGAMYSLSKQTSVYAVAVHQNASGIDSTNVKAVADIGAASPSSSNSQTLAIVGLSHKF